MIIAVEASPITYQKLIKNLNPYPNIVPINFAVCDSPNETIKFYHANVDTISTLNIDWLTAPHSRFCNYTKYQEVEVKTISFDTMIEQFGKPDFIKVDVEGAEDQVITSLSQKVDVLAFEWSVELYDVSQRCLEHLRKLGFKKYHIQHEDKYTYWPGSFELEYEEVLEKLKTTKIRLDWGMVWAC